MLDRGHRPPAPRRARCSVGPLNTRMHAALWADPGNISRPRRLPPVRDQRPAGLSRRTLGPQDPISSGCLSREESARTHRDFTFGLTISLHLSFWWIGGWRNGYGHASAWSKCRFRRRSCQSGVHRGANGTGEPRPAGVTEADHQGDAPDRRAPVCGAGRVSSASWRSTTVRVPGASRLASPAKPCTFVVDLACRKAKDLGYPHEVWTTRLLAKARARAGCGCWMHFSWPSQGTLCKMAPRSSRTSCATAELRLPIRRREDGRGRFRLSRSNS